MTIDESAERTNRDPAPAVTRSIRLLGLLAESMRPLTLTELAGGLGLAKSSTANLCLSLEAGRLIERVPRGYRLAVGIAELGGAFAAQFNQVREFYSVCESSDVLSTELVQVAMLDDRDTLYIARHEGSRTSHLGTPLGSRLPAALSATGRALLMTFTDTEIASLLEGTLPLPMLAASGVIDLERLLAKLRRARELGWALDEEESFPGVVGVAVPLPGWAPGDPLLALGVGLPSAEATPARIERVGQALLSAADSLTNPLRNRRRDSLSSM